MNITANLWQLIYPSDVSVVVYMVHSFTLYALAVAVILIEIIRSEFIDIDKVMGALCIYLLLGVVYADLYQLIETLLPGSFVYNNKANFNDAVTNFDLIYYSFTTLTTVGFGDIIAVTKQAKSVVVLEEITGVLYLAALVSRLVSSLSRR